MLNPKPTQCEFDGFSEVQVAELTKKLDIRFVRSRSGGGGGQFSYIEGHHAIREANRIFGHGKWDSRLEELTLTAENEADGKWRVSYLAKVQIIVQVPDSKEPIVREGIGAGHGYNRNPGEAHEMAAKEAETDALKRALRTFGNPFGLALYDKEQKEVEFEVYEYDLPAPKEGSSTDAVAEFVISRGGRITEGGKVKSVNPIPELEKKREEKPSRSIEMDPSVLEVK